jgi:hypothetical protein
MVVKDQRADGADRQLAVPGRRPMSYDRYGTLTGLWRSPSERSSTTLSSPSFM